MLTVAKMEQSHMTVKEALTFSPECKRTAQFAVCPLINSSAPQTQGDRHDVDPGSLVAIAMDCIDNQHHPHHLFERETLISIARCMMIVVFVQ